jgi:hypothetical protein
LDVPVASFVFLTDDGIEVSVRYLTGLEFEKLLDEALEDDIMNHGGFDWYPVSDASGKAIGLELYLGTDSYDSPDLGASSIDEMTRVSFPKTVAWVESAYGITLPIADAVIPE